MFTTWPRSRSKCGTAAGAADQGDKVQFHEVAELLGSGVEECAAHGPAGVIYKDVEAAEAVQGLVKQAIHVVLAGDIGLNSEDVESGGLHFLCGAGEGLGFQGGDGRFRPCRGKRFGDYPA